ncbi:family 43 glycosylhydrolase [Agromyces sp. MMS24-JH15]|uniref:glycoside hydrolase family 43 protein n=1 Tax=Agromyces sp. MMS24-JH15 TaxID=3243765 RepID=UPI00374A262C
MASYRNPVVPGHAPDPSVVLVGDRFLLVNSSFGMLPGLPIRSSTDLVHWETIGHAVTRPSQYRRDGLPGPVELFAPTIRHHDGVFYVVCTNAHPGQGNFLVTATDPAGEWSDAIWLDAEAFDPSLFRDDDGAWFYTRRSLEFGRPDGNLGPIVQARIDLDTGALGELRPITPGSGGFVTNDIEGPHLFRRGDWYYLTGAEGSSWKGHLQSIGRSRSPWGPFEPAPHNPIVTHRDRVGHPIQSLGHVDFVEDGDGRWWALALGTRHAPLSQHHNIGRETFLLPVEWVDDWPVVGRAGTTELVVDGVELPVASTPAPAPAPAPGPAVRPRLGPLDWVTVGEPPAGLVRDRDPAEGIILSAGGDLTETTRPIGALLTRQTSDRQRFSVRVEAVSSSAGTGVAVFVNRTHHYSAVVRGDGGERVVVFRRHVDDLVAEQATPIPGRGALVLRIEAHPDRYDVVALVDGGEKEIACGTGSARLLSAESVEWFESAHFALVHAGEPGTAPARFAEVALEDPPADPPVIVPPFIRELRPAAS